MCVEGVLRFVVFLASSPCSTGASSSGFHSAWPVWSWSFSCARFNSVLKPICILRAAYFVR